MNKNPKGSTLAEFLPLHPAEQALLDACGQGVVADISVDRPTERTADNVVRADFLRFLSLGGDGDAVIHEHGIQLRGAWVDGVLDLEGGHIPSRFSCMRTHFAQEPQCMRAEFDGLINLSGSCLPGWQADGIKVMGGIFLHNGFKAEGEIRLLGAQIGGGLTCSQAELDGKDGDALSLDGVKIKGSVFLDDGFKATGEVRLLGAQIGGNLECAQAELDGKDGNALSMDRTKVEGGVFLDDGFKATGQVRLLGAQIGGSLDCSQAELDGKDGDALSMDGVKIKGSVFLRNGFKVTGQVRLPGAQIGGDLDCSQAKLDGLKQDALTAEHARVHGAFIFKRLKTPVHGVNLTAAFVTSLVDDVASWGEGLVLDGFSYDRIGGGAPTDAQTRLGWLDKQRIGHSGANGHGADFRPAPWRQLQKVLREMGHAEDARQVGIALEDRLRHAGLIGQAPKHWNRIRRWSYTHAARGFHWLFKALIGYGYRPLRLAFWMVLAWLFCATFYWHAALQGVMGPSNPLVFQRYEECRSNWYVCERLPEEYTGFSPLVYSLDVILPLVNLQQENDWAPLIPTPKASWQEELFFHWTLNHGVRLVLWLEILFGWVSSLLLVAVVSGLTKRRED